MKNKQNKEKDCDKPEIRDSFKDGCSEEQKRKCHGDK